MGDEDALLVEVLRVHLVEGCEVGLNESDLLSWVIGLLEQIH
jgi:hypothetical protein